MSILAGFAIVVTEAVVSFYKRLHAIQFGVYGASQVGKTTLHHQLRTRGEVPDIKKRTVGLHKGTRKTIKVEGEVHTVKSADVGGESFYWKEWKNYFYCSEYLSLLCGEYFFQDGSGSCSRISSGSTFRNNGGR